MNMRTIILTAVLLTVAMPPILYPQTPGPSSPAQTESAGDDETPVPYDPEEFPQWARDLRRGEIVATGSFPLTLLASRLLYGLGRFLVQSIQSRGVDLTYAPWFLLSPGAVPLQRNEKIIIIASAGGLSVSLSLLDYLLAVRERRTEDGR